jgi:hypothetical protein
MSYRHFRADAALYESMRLALDSAWGLPDVLTRTCLRPAGENAPRDADGLVVVGVAAEWCEWEPAATMLPPLLESGQVQEITLQQYLDAVALAE